MEKKNTVLLTVIAVATLLVAVVGATFAYFTATNTTDNSGNQITSNTTRAQVGGVSLTLTTESLTDSSNIEYPGGYLVNGAKVTAISTGTEDDYDVDYSLKGKINNGTKTQLNYKVYLKTSQVTGSIVTGCERHQFQDASNNLIYTYATLNGNALANPSDGKYATSCQVTGNITGGTEIASGTVAANTDDFVFTIRSTGDALDTNTDFYGKTGMKLTSATGSGNAKYYYLVVEYPETGSETQNETDAVSITAVLNAVENSTAVVK